MLVATKIVDAISVMVESCRSLNDVVTQMIAGVPSTSIGEVVVEVHIIDDILNDPTSWKMLSINDVQASKGDVCGLERYGRQKIELASLCSK